MESKINNEQHKNKKKITNYDTINIIQRKNSIRYDPNDDRPIKSNKTGKYNLDFIDWNNEHERVFEIINKIDKGESLEDKVEEKRIRKYLKIEEEKNGIHENIKFETVKNIDTRKECYICLKNFTKKSIVKKIFCGHMFCEECLFPWIKYNHVCPICKYEFPQKNPID